MARNASSTARFSAAIGSPDLSEACSRNRSAISPALRPPTVSMPAIARRSSTSALAPAWSALSSAASTPACAERALARPAEDGVEAAPAGDAAAEAAAPHVGNFKRFKHAVEEARVADPRGEHAAPRRRRRLKAQREHFGVCRLGVLAAEALEPGLRLLAALPRPSAEHRAEIGIFGDGAGPVRIEIGAADGNRIFRPQAQLLARGVGGQEQAAADLLARHVEEDSRRMQDRRFGPLEPGGEEMIERALAGAARRLAHGIGKGRRFNGRGHRMALMVVSAPFNKAASSAQPFSRGRVNAELAREGVPGFAPPPRTALKRRRMDGAGAYPPTRSEGEADHVPEWRGGGGKLPARPGHGRMACDEA